MIDAQSQTQSKPTQFGSSELAAIVEQLDDALSTIEQARSADVCGAAGCRKSEKLLRASIDRLGNRVLCAEHLAQLLRREVCGQ